MKILNSVADLSSEEIVNLIHGADQITALRKAHGHLPSWLKGFCLGMIFDETSLRTRSAFERGMGDLGGQSIYYSSADIRIGAQAKKKEHLPDLMNVLARFNDALLVRVYDQSIQRDMIGLSKIPYINGMCNQHHPTQALCDFLTIKRRFGTFQDLKVAFIGDGTNVALSLAQVASKVGCRFAIATPPGWELPSSQTHELKGYSSTHRADEAAEGADVIVGDVWIPMNKADEAAERRKVLAPYQIDSRLMGLAARRAIFLHNLPATRGEEVTSEVIDGPQSAVYEEAGARLDIARALLMSFLLPDWIEKIQAASASSPQ